MKKTEEGYREWGETPKAYTTPDMIVTHREGFSPCIYVWRRQGTVLYVGMSTVGLGRPFATGHLRVRGLEADDVVDVFLCPTATEAQLRIHEREFVEYFKPTLNKNLHLKKRARGRRWNRQTIRAKKAERLRLASKKKRWHRI